ncbi:MAG: glycosyltransferase family A protein [Planctomycetota bacterium]|nr:glycosyltransferase family A protein [Planctomycetota bacterium]
MPDRPAVEFVVPAYNAADTLADTLRSLVAQSEPRWRAVVVDDGGQDNPEAVVGEINDPRIRIERRTNGGLAAARNTGYRSTTAPAICFLDADDLVEPDFARRMLARLRDADAAACWFRYVGPMLDDLGWTYRVGEHDLHTDRLAGMNPLGVGGVVVRRDALDRVRGGGAVFDESLPVVEDWDLWLRLDAIGARWAIEPAALFVCRLRAQSLSAGVERMWREGLRVVRTSAAAAARRAGLDERALERRWHLRHLARGVAADDAGLVRAIRAELGPLTADDDAELVGALREAFCRRHAVGEHDAGMRAAAWRATIARCLPDRPALAPRVSWTPGRWATIARRAAAAVPAGGTLVIYGLGLNGRAALDALADGPVPVAAIDDHPGAHCPVPRLGVHDLTSSHRVLVTPDRRETIVSRLREAGIDRVLLPEMFEDEPARRAS